MLEALIKKTTAKKTLGLRWRMVLIIVVLPLLILTPIFAFMGYRYRDSYRDARLGKGEMITRQIDQAVRSVTPYISSIQDVSGLDTYLRESIEGQPEIAFSALVLDNGFIVYHSLPGLGGTFAEGFTQLPAQGYLKRTVLPYDELYLVVRSFPQPGREDRLMYAVVGEYIDAVEPTWVTWLPALMGVMIALPLIALMQYFVQRVILNPLRELAAGAALIGAGDLAHEIPVKGADEMSFLAQSFNQMSHQLQELVGTLERQVAERTSDLQNKTAQLQAVAVVSREAVSTSNVHDLLETAVHAIAQQFNYDHAGIFLVDDAGEWAMLRAASSEGGRQMLARNHRLRVGHQGIVGSVAATGQPRIALDVGEDAVWFDTPELPKTRSELALPLVDMDGNIVGVVDVQSNQPAAFTPEDIETLQLLADQLSIVLRNARLMEQTQGALAELETLQRDYSNEGWARVVTSMRPTAYEYDRVDVQPVLPLPVPPELLDSTASHRVVLDGGRPVMMEPMRYRDQVVGVVSLSDPHRIWTDDEVQLVQNVTDQVAIALDNARLFEEAQHNARQQALLNFVLQTAATTIDPDQALREIAEVLAQGLGMGVGIFTFPRPDIAEVRLQAFVSPGGQSLVKEGTMHALPEEFRIFFRGLTEPELAKMLPISGSAKLSENYDMDEVLYVSIRTATAMTGFIAMVQGVHDTLLGPETRTLARNLASQVSVVLENLKLFEESQRRSQEMQSLYEVSLRFSEQLEPAVVRQIIIQQAAELFTSDSCAFLLHDSYENVLRFSEVTGNLERYHKLTVKPGEGLSGVVFEQAAPLRVDDYASWDKRVDDISRWEIRAALGVPLISAQGVLGVLLMTRKPGRPLFEDADVRLAELFAAQATVALENARLYQESSKRAQDLQQLYDAGLELVSMLDIEKILDESANWALRIFSAQTVKIAFWNENANRYQTGTAAESSSWEKRMADFNLDPTPMVNGIRQAGKAIFVDDLRNAVHFPPQLVQAGLYSLIAVPLRLGVKVGGVIWVSSDTVGYFTHDDLQLLEFFGSQTASALQNALLFGQVQTTLTVVESQARYQTSVAQASALLVEQGTKSLNEVLGVLSDAATVDQSYYAEIYEASEDDYFRLMAAWRAANPHGESDAQMMRSFPKEIFSDHWLSLLQTTGVVQSSRSEASSSEQKIFDLLEMQSFLALAIQSQGELRGILSFVDSREERAWSKEELVALQTIAASLSSTLAREDLLTRVQEALADTEILLEAGTALNIAQTYEHILEVLLNYTIIGQGAIDAVIQIFNHPWTSVYGPPEWADTLARSSSLADAKFSSSRYRLDDFPSFTEILHADRLGVIEDVPNAPNIDENLRAFLQHLGAQAAVFIPLVVGGQWIGFISAIYPKAVDFSEEELRRLMSITAQAAVAIQNRYQLDVTAARARREQLIREITGEIQAAPDVEGVLQAAARELGLALQVPRTFVRLGGLDEGKRRKPDTGPLSSLSSLSPSDGKDA